MRTFDVTCVIVSLCLVGAMQDFYHDARKKDTKDCYLDLSRLLQWRWKDRGGMQVLTGSKVFVSRSSSRHRPRQWAQTDAEAVH